MQRQITALFLLLIAQQILAEEKIIKIGILSERPTEFFYQQWKPVEEVINKNIPLAHFSIEPSTIDELENKVASRQIDYVLTNPSHFLYLYHRYGLSAPILSLRHIEQEKIISSFGGVIFTLADRTDISKLSDLLNKSIGISSRKSFAGYQTQFYELKQQGIQLPDNTEFKILNYPQDNVVEAVLSKKVDVGFVRTGLLEQLSKEGKIDLQKIKIINQQNLPNFPLVISTRLYPEWLLAANPHVDTEISRQLVGYLLTLKNKDSNKSFNIPQDYTSIENLLRELHLPPFDIEYKITFQDIWDRYHWLIIISIMVFVGIVSLLIRLILIKQRFLESQKIWKFALEGAGDGLWDWDIKNSTVFFSHRWKEMLGFSDKEIGNGLDEWEKRIHPDDKEHTIETITAYLEDKTPIYISEHRVSCKDGTYKWVLDRGMVIERDKSGKPIRMIGTHADITERINAFENLQNSQQELQLLTSMIEDSQDPFYVLDINDGFRMTFVNNAGCKHYGLPTEKLLTMRVPDWDPDVNLDKLLEMLPVLREEKHLLLKTRHLVSDGIIPVEVSINYLKNEKSEYAFGYIVDLRERIELEDTMRKAKENAELLAKSKSEFLANMSHEIRTPMTAIIGLSQLSLNKEMSEDVRDSLTKIYQSSHSLLGILNDILDFSKLDVGKLTLEKSTFSLVTIFRNLYNLFSVSAKNKNLEFSISVEHDVPNELIGDALRLQQILSNLLGNAIKFTEHGKIELRIKQIENRAEKTVLRFSVEDTGIGIKAEQQENLFNPFHQADNSITRRFGGTGLGLTISRDLLRLMDSDFHIDSVEGQGTTIYFDLLLKIPNIQTLNQSVSVPSNQQGTLQERLSEMSKSLVGAKILFAEDNALNQEIVSGFLKMSGIEVDIAENGIIALELLKSNSYDAILMDVHMPEMDGLQATQVIREQSKYADLPIIALTAGITVEEQEKCLSAGMNNLVEKPINPEILLLTLSRCVKTN